MNDSKFNYIRSLGFSGALNEITTAFYRYVGAIGNTIQDLETDMFDTMGIARGALQDRWNTFLARVGYSGDNEKAWGDGITYGKILQEQAMAAIRRNGGSAWFVPDSLTNSGIYTDSTGVTPVSTVGDVLGLVTDRSYGGGNLGVELWNSAAATLGAGWSRIGDTFTSDGTSSNIGLAVLTAGETYQFKVTISGGALNLYLGAATYVLSATGTYSWTSAASDPNIYIRNTSTGVKTAANISVRKVLGNHATQSTTANKPKLVQVPRRLGPELVVNGGFDTDASGWSAINSSLTVTAGELVVTHTSGGYPQGYVSVPTTIGRTYLVTGNLRRGTETANAGLTAQDASGNSIATGVDTSSSSLVTLRTTFVAVTSMSRAVVFHNTGTPTGTVMADNISVREVLEFGWGMGFDGVDDSLTIPKLINIGSDHTVICSGKSPASLATYPFIFSPADNAGASYSTSAMVAQIYVDAGKYLVARYRNDAGVVSYVSAGGVKTLNENQAFVTSVVSKSGGLTTIYHDGVTGYSIATPTGTSSTAVTGRIGAGDSYWGGSGSFFCVTPTAISTSDRIAIERFAAYLSGVTLISTPPYVASDYYPLNGYFWYN